MGTSDARSLPVIVFATAYFFFIILMFAIIPGQTTQTYSSNCTSTGIGANRTTTCGVDSTSSFIVSFVNLYDNITELGAWNLLLFMPVILALGYIVLVLAIPGWL
jgi:ABC-type Na+ efflux pump permease subunit